MGFLTVGNSSEAQRDCCPDELGAVEVVEKRGIGQAFSEGLGTGAGAALGAALAAGIVWTIARKKI